MNPRNYASRQSRRKSLVPQAPVFKSSDAFTLAEVLITLAIIGVVAVMTLPTVLQKYEERATITKLKKIYSMLNQAYQMVVIENGTIDQWGLINTAHDEDDTLTDDSVISTNTFWDLMTKYLKVEKVCRFYEECNLTDFKIKSLDGQILTNKTGNAVLLNDGTLFWGGNISDSTCSADYGVPLAKNVCGDFGVIIKNSAKSEYTTGKNNFMFFITKNGIVPMGLNGINIRAFSNHCLRANAGDKYNGYGCTAWVLQNENMDYLHCDDLSWDGKHKCSDRD